MKVTWRSATAGVVAAGALLAVAGCSSVPSAEVGECVDVEMEDGLVAGFDVKDCDEEHDAEAFYVAELPEGDYPGSAAFQQVAVDECLPAFEEYTGAAYGVDPDLDIQWVEPTRDSWDNNDRNLTCFVVQADGSTSTGSVRGSGA